MIYFYQLGFLVLTYLISAIPFGLVLAKIFGKQDIRQHGSGNIGATNVTRVLGKKLGALTLILDAIKGATMVVLARYLFVDSQFSSLSTFLVLVAAIAVVGHIFPIYLKFKGGKGVATTFGVLLAVNPFIGLIACLAWIIIFIFTKTSSIASLSSTLITVGFSFYADALTEEILLCIFLAILIFIRHKENIHRILNDQEQKIK
ncbi:MAG: hypothetical protein K0R25_820 [Rickettsiaceae bacterium]|jgi:glycerol-3-phosphate acyltransferase PlsY|nr:hypothetical protein [Rickettsiaceae bacterium]